MSSVATPRLTGVKRSSAVCVAMSAKAVKLNDVFAPVKMACGLINTADGDTKALREACRKEAQIDDGCESHNETSCNYD